ncbi:GNAT family N-acetyltransferase [Arcanobacterium ihumii]|uniref:GNAT family N-acetyltransferase n=1 Tax=Arcanobacterium ihumii TaxID=2138162 RepID=UPI000F526349|nr:GNAT family N-acetyltransferase [Arcanobacterium ihumii]
MTSTQTPGFWLWKELTVDDVATVGNLISLIEEADQAAIRTTRQEVESYFSESQVWLAEGAWVGSELVAFSFIRASRSDDGLALTVSGGVHTRWRARGLGAELLERQQENARELTRRLGYSGARMSMYIDSDQGDLANLATLYSFTESARYLQYRRSLVPKPITPELGRYLEIIPLTKEFEPEVWSAHQKFMSQNSLGTVENYEQWLELRSSMVDKWCFVALDTFGDRPELAGYVLCSKFRSFTTDDTEDEGYIEEIAVLPQWRDRNLVENLVANCMDAFKRDSMKLIGIDLESDKNTDVNQTAQMLRLYNFEKVAEMIVVDRDI